MSTQTVPTHSIPSRENVFAAQRRDPRLHRRAIETLREWRRRIGSRRELAHLSDIELRDIGYPAQIAAEKNKPFWRA